MSAEHTARGGTTPATSPTLGGWRGPLVRLGYWRAMALITVLSIGASMVLTTLLLLPETASPIDTMTGLIIGLAIPALIAPLVSHALLTLLIDLDQTRQQINELAHRDALTHTHTRHFFVEQLSLNAARAARTGEPLSLLMLDVDHFSRINEQHGQAAGDLVLQAIAGVCDSTLRPYDILARYGGEEFAVLLPNTTPAGACAVSERLRTAVESLRIETATGINTEVTVSIGVSALHLAQDTAQQLLARTDLALVTAKQAGRNRWVFKGESEAQNPAPLHFRVSGLKVQDEAQAETA